MVTKPTIRIASKRSSLIEAMVILISSANQATPRQPWKRNDNAMVKGTSIWLRNESPGVIRDKSGGSKSPKYLG
jgi:hypothetical protein